MHRLADQTLLGEAILGLRTSQNRRKKLTTLIDANQAILAAVPRYQEGPFMSNDPAEHHSKTPQDAPVPWDGGES